MELIAAQYTASISELKKNPSTLIARSNGSAIAILNNNRPIAYLVPTETYEAMLEQLEDNELVKSVNEREHEIATAEEVNLGEL